MIVLGSKALRRTSRGCRGIHRTSTGSPLGARYEKMKSHCVGNFSDMQILPYVCASSAKSTSSSCAHAISNGDRNHPMSTLRAELAQRWREIRIW